MLVQKTLKTLLFGLIVLGITSIAPLFNAQKAYAACTSTNSVGTVQKPITVNNTGDYKIWLKTSGATVPVSLEINGGTCLNGTSQTTLQWVLLGTTSLQAGTQTFKGYAYGNNVIFYAAMITDASSGCVPSGDGSNCITEYNNSTSTPPSSGGGTAAPPYSNVIIQTNNIASGATITASSSCCGSNPGKVIDKIEDNNDNRWVSDSKDGEWLMIDLGSSKTIKTLSILWAADSTKNHTIQTSDNGTTFRSAVSSITNNSPFQLLSYSLGNQSARYLRIYASSRWNSSVGNSIRELAVYEGYLAPGSAPTATGVFIHPTPSTPGSASTSPVTEVTPNSVIAIDQRLTSDIAFTNEVVQIDYLVEGKIIKSIDPRKEPPGISDDLLPSGTYELTERITMSDGTVLSKSAMIRKPSQFVAIRKAANYALITGSGIALVWSAAIFTGVVLRKTKSQKMPADINTYQSIIHP